MEYFKKLSVKTIPQTIIDCPVRIQEIAILQDSFDKNILGRIKFVNQSKENVIAVFLDLSAKDISGEPVTLNNNSFIYQDICVEPGELYGNKIAIDLPDAVRMLSAEINRVVFEDGTVWKSSDAKTCQPFVLEQIEQPQENFDRIRDELIKTIPNIDYVNYYFQENESAWLCSCGKINSSDDKLCSFCGCGKSALEDVLTKEHFSSFCDNINKIVEEEEAQAAKIAAEKEQQRIKEEARKAEEERKRKEEENKRREEEANKERALREEEERRAAKRRKNIITTVVPLIVIAIIGIFALFNFYIAPNNSYNQAVALMNDGDYQSAYDIFANLNGFKDSDELASEANDIIAEEKYNSALAYMDNEHYQLALDLLNSITWYKDSNEIIDEAENKIKENDYIKACDLFYTGYDSEAKDIFEQLDDYKDSDEFLTKIEERTVPGNHISFDMNLSETQDLLGTIIPADTIETDIRYNIYINSDITSEQAAQLVGVLGMENLDDIKSLSITFSNNKSRMINIQFTLSNLNKQSSFYEVSENDPEIHKYIQELAYTITDTENTEISFKDSKDSSRLKYKKSEGSFDFAGYKFTITITYQDEVGKQSIELRNLDNDSSSSVSSSKSSSSSSTSHTCQASGCNKAGTYAITGLNGTTEYYCSEHYSQMSGMMNMIMGN